ncbi:MAG: redoxin domain-containing protein [Candidatus Zixiibacteriota bacterium]|nr:MAG: redoxin domain-containing protein [candidate division Zixibacteria bacterium]
MKKTISVVILVLSLGVAPGDAQDQFQVGDKMPAFDMPYATKDSINVNGISSEDLQGKRYLLAFYPADWSPGCTKEICAFRDAYTDFSDLDVEVMAISGDYVYSHHAWAKHHNLDFKLLADHTRKYGKKMGVYLDESDTMQRSVFVVGPDGTFEYIDYEYSVADDKDFNALKEFLASKK